MVTNFNELKILFLGDSITEGFDFKKFFPDHYFINKGVSGDSTIECLSRINENYFNIKYDFIFICIGTNDLARERSDEQILININSIIKKIKSYENQSKIVITSIFPTKFNKPRPNKRIIELNNKIKELAKNKSLLYFDLHQYFINENNQLKSEYTEDGLHLTTLAYEKWAQELKNYLAEILL